MGHEKDRIAPRKATQLAEAHLSLTSGGVSQDLSFTDLLEQRLQFSEATIDAFMVMLSSPDHEERLMAAGQIMIAAKLGGPTVPEDALREAEHTFARAFSSEDTAEVVTACMMLCSGLVPLRAAKEMQLLFKKLSGEIRISLAIALIQTPLADAEVVAVLRNALAPENEELALTAAVALLKAGLHIEECWAVIRSLASSGDMEMLFRIAIMMSELGARAQPCADILEGIVNNAEVPSSWRAIALVALGSATADTELSHGTFLSHLRSSNTELVLAALAAISASRCCSEGVATQVVALLVADQVLIRSSAARVLSEMGKSAVYALGPLIARFGQEEDHGVILALVNGVAACGTDAIGPLINKLHDANRVESDPCLRCFAQIGIPAINPLLDEMFSASTNDERMIISLEYVLENMEAGREEAADLVVARLTNTVDLETKLYLLRALVAARVVPAVAIPSLLSFLDQQHRGLSALVMKALQTAPAMSLVHAAKTYSPRTATGRAGLQDLLANWEAVMGERLARYQRSQIPKALRVFMYAAQALERRGKLSMQEIAAEFAARCGKDWPNDLPTSVSGVEKNIRRFQEEFGVRLRDSRAGRVGELTLEATAHLSSLEDYHTLLGLMEKP